MQADTCSSEYQEKENATMKKYTTPEVEVIKFQSQETIAAESEIPDASVGVGGDNPWNDPQE